MQAGDQHYRAYVGPPEHYDFMGASQFRLLTTLGLRAEHSLLDVGCGSLRAGKLLISYLDKGHYCGIEPNPWLIEEAVANELGEDLLRLKAPLFDNNSHFDISVFDRSFDFIIAQSIFSHTGSDMIGQALDHIKSALKPEGLVLATFVRGGDDFQGQGWVYPGCVRYRDTTVKQFAKEAGFMARRISWYHPSQVWYVLATKPQCLPNRVMMRHLSGAVLRDPAYANSWQPRKRLLRNVKNWLSYYLPPSIKNRVKKWLAKSSRNVE